MNVDKEIHDRLSRELEEAEGAIVDVVDALEVLNNRLPIVNWDKWRSPAIELLNEVRGVDRKNIAKSETVMLESVEFALSLNSLLENVDETCAPDYLRQSLAVIRNAKSRVEKLAEETPNDLRKMYILLSGSVKVGSR